MASCKMVGTVDLKGWEKNRTIFDWWKIEWRCCCAVIVLTEINTLRNYQLLITAVA